MNFRVNRIVPGLNSLEGRVLKSLCKRTCAMVLLLMLRQVTILTLEIFHERIISVQAHDLRIWQHI